MADQLHNIYDLGLDADLAMFTRSGRERRQILKMGAVGIGMLLAGCGTSSVSTGAGAPTTAAGSSGATSAPAATAAASGSATASCVSEIPGETAGPYPADGSQASRQDLNALALSGIVRQDIRTSLGTGTTAQGIPTTIKLKLVNVNASCAVLADHAIYIWHCDRDGQYSMYSEGVTDEDYLRGVQATGSDGVATFTTVFPACYPGRWPHVHFEIYPSVAQATGASNVLHTSQLALPQDVCETAYATDGYSGSVRNLGQLSLQTDNVFGDGSEWQLATVTGDPTSGYTVELTVGITA